MYNYFSFWTCVLLFVVCFVLYKAMDFTLFVVTRRLMSKKAAAKKAALMAEMEGLAKDLKKAADDIKIKAKAEREGQEDPQPN